MVNNLLFMPPENCTVRNLLDRNVQQFPELIMLRFDTGETFTATQLHNKVRKLASNLLNCGIKQYTPVLVWLPNCPLSVTLFLALNYIGAIFVPINIAYRGRLLEHVIHNSAAKMMIVDGRLLKSLETVELSLLENLLIDGDERVNIPSLQQSSTELLWQDEENAVALSSIQIQANDTQTVIYTSGTTGPSKGVLCSYLHLYTAALEFRHIGPGDCNLVVLPMFHVGGVLGMLFALIHGGCAAYVERFSTSKFWPTVSNMKVTTVGLLGAMVQYLMGQAESENEKVHSLKTAVIAPFGDEAIAFGERFGVDVYTEFNMTELSVPLFCGPNPQVRGTCGKQREGVELKLVDGNDMPVPLGEKGELILKTNSRWEISHGYLNDPEATALTWRNGWFHTGDIFYENEDGYFFFVDRAKDMLRRKGENISSVEVEAELLSFPSVMEAAIVATPGDGGEDEVLAVLACKELPKIIDLVNFLQQRMAHFMVPRYFRFMTSLPKTPTEKIEKHLLRSEGITSDTIDRVKLGIEVKTVGLQARS